MTNIEIWTICKRNRETSCFDQLLLIFLHTFIYLLPAVNILFIVGNGMQAIGKANYKPHNRIRVFVFDLNLYEIIMYYIR